MHCSVRIFVCRRVMTRLSFHESLPGAAALCVTVQLWCPLEVPLRR